MLETNGIVHLSNILTMIWQCLYFFKSQFLYSIELIDNLFCRRINFPKVLSHLLVVLRKIIPPSSKPLEFISQSFEISFYLYGIFLCFLRFYTQKYDREHSHNSCRSHDIDAFGITIFDDISMVCIYLCKDSFSRYKHKGTFYCVYWLDIFCCFIYLSF